MEWYGGGKKTIGTRQIFGNNRCNSSVICFIHRDSHRGKSQKVFLCGENFSNHVSMTFRMFKQ